MAWPQLDDFRWAIQEPAMCFSDPELQAGEVVCDMFGMPKMASGNFACAYEIQCANKMWAVRTFNHEVTDQHLRYQMVSQHLGSVGVPYMVRFSFHPEGILVGGSWYPIVKMTWVEGMTLTRWVKDHREQPEMIRDLAKHWRGMVGALYGLQMAHADLQHGNVLVTPQDEVKLIDYDGMFVPKMQGNSAPELGHPNWNHPGRNNDTFGPYLDQFPGLVGYISMLAVAQQPHLLDEYCNDENLILSQADLAAPKNSEVVHELKNMEDDGVSELTDALIKWCEEGVDYDTLENVATGGSSPPIRMVDHQKSTTVPAGSIEKKSSEKGKSDATNRLPIILGAAVVVLAVAGYFMFSTSTETDQAESAPPPSETPVPVVAVAPPVAPVEQPTPAPNAGPPDQPPAENIPPLRLPQRSGAEVAPRPAQTNTAGRPPQRAPTPPPVIQSPPETVPAASPAPPKSRFEFDSAEEYYDRGLQRLGDKDWAGAEKDFGLAIAMNATDPVYFRERGNVRLRIGDLVGARLDYDKAISLDPRYSSAYNSRGVLRRRQGDLQGARADYDRAIALNPIESTFFRNRGNLRRQQGDLQGALEDYDHTISLNDEDSIAFNSRGVVRVQLGDMNGAHVDYDRAIEINPTEPSFYQNRSNLRRQMGDLAGAQEDLDQALSLKSSR